MPKVKNAHLEAYEIKKPDYDLIHRLHIGLLYPAHSPARYIQENDLWTSTQATQKDKVQLMFLGDITCFGRQFDAARFCRLYNFRYQLDQMKPLFAQADLVAGNLETTIFPQAPYRNEKFVSEQSYHCNAPVEFLDAIRHAGIDIVTTANNHDLDTGAIGIGETIDHIERMGLIQTGTFKTRKKKYSLINVHGFRIAIAAFATEHNHKRCNLTKEGVDFLLNDYSPDRAKSIIEQARADGAELVFCCIHWGKENKTVHNETQTAIAQELADLGYDCIIGSHPHVLQPFSYVYSGSKAVPVFYSLGNFLSHNVNNAKSRSAIACIELTRGDKNIGISCSYIPVFTSADFGPKKYVVLPLPQEPSDPRNAQKAKQIADILGKEIPVNSTISYSELFEKSVVPQSDPDAAAADAASGSTADNTTGSVKRTKPKPKAAVKYPFSHRDALFSYSVYEDHACLNEFFEDMTTGSYSVPSHVRKRPLTQMKDGVFRGNTRIMKINFSKELKHISPYAMKDCMNLEGFQLSGGIAEIGTEAFCGCTRLVAAVMTRNVEKIDSKAFANCSRLRSVKLSRKVTQIADDAFKGCKKATFYCEADSYAEKYARDHGFPVVIMSFD